MRAGNTSMEASNGKCIPNSSHRFKKTQSDKHHDELPTVPLYAINIKKMKINKPKKKNINHPRKRLN